MEWEPGVHGRRGAVVLGRCPEGCNAARNAPRRQVLIEAAGVTVRHGRTTVLDRVDLRLHAGEILSLIGPNGSGKTTLVRALLGLQPAEGRIARPAGLRIGYVPQHLPIDRTLPLTVDRFLRLVGRRRAAGLDEALAEVGLPAALLRQPMQGLSGGEARRVLLAAALLGRPELLVLDEATAGMDVAGLGEFYDLVRRLRDERGCGILMVSHDLHLVMAATDFVLCLDTHVCCTGRPEAVSRDPAFLSLFGGAVPPQLAVYHHDLAHHQEHHAHAADEAEHRHG
jgi:zinc transport system ATP-binding protein